MGSTEKLGRSGIVRRPQQYGISHFIFASRMQIELLLLFRRHDDTQIHRLQRGGRWLWSRMGLHGRWKHATVCQSITIRFPLDLGHTKPLVEKEASIAAMNAFLCMKQLFIGVLCFSPPKDHEVVLEYVELSLVVVISTCLFSISFQVVMVTFWSVRNRDTCLPNFWRMCGTWLLPKHLTRYLRPVRISNRSGD